MKKIKYHLGCGRRNFGKDWHHVDAERYDHVQSYDIVHLPCENNTVDLIYASHVLEYFNRSEARNVLKLWFDKLKPGGVLRLAVPNFRVIASLYSIGKYPLDRFLGPLYGQMESNNEIIYHRTCYDFESLDKLLQDTGFYPADYWNWQLVDHGRIDDQSQAYLPHMEKENGVLISLNVQAIKP